MAQCLRLLTAVTEDLDSVPSVHIRWLTVSCHFSSRIPLASLCMQCTPIHAGTCTHTHHLKQNETNFGCLLSPSLHSSLHSMILGLTFRLPWFWGCKPRLCTSRRSIAPPRRIWVPYFLSSLWCHCFVVWICMDTPIPRAQHKLLQVATIHWRFLKINSENLQSKDTEYSHSLVSLGHWF